MSISAVLLAAGQSTRMGRIKALLPWQGTSLIRFQAEQLLEAGVDEVVAVLGYAAAKLRPQVRGIRGVRTVVNEEYALGRAGSVRLGVASLSPEAEAVVILGVDQPRPSSLIRRLLSAYHKRQALITVPSYQGRRGHPALFARSLFPELAAVTEEAQGLREVMVRHRRDVHEVDVDDPVVLLDLNTPSDYERGQRVFNTTAQRQR